MLHKTSLIIRPPTVLLTTDVGGPFRSSEVPFEHHGLVPGDNVRVGLDVDVFKIMQEGHGDWDDSLLNVSLIDY